MVLIWLRLLVLLLEFLAAYLPAVRGSVQFIGSTMAFLVALTFMRRRDSQGRVPVFAIAGLFWLCVMLGPGSLDSFTRHDILIQPRVNPSAMNCTPPPPF